MEEIFEILNDILSNGKFTNLTNQNVQITKNENGDVNIIYRNPANNEEFKKIEEYFDSLDDDICSEASEHMKKNDIYSYNVISRNLDNPQNLDELKDAVIKFKNIVKEVAQSEIKELSERIDYLYDKYIKE